jgi:hypothetical protein
MSCPFRAGKKIRNHEPGALPQAGLFGPFGAQSGSFPHRIKRWAFTVSIPHISLIKLDAVPLEQRAEFILKAHPAMMFLLAFDVSPHRLDVGLAHRKSRVSRLPTELRKARTIILYPFGTTLLYFLDNLLQWMVFRQCEERMNMVFHAANDERGAFPLLEDASLVSEQSVAMYLWNPRLAVLRAVNQVHEIFDEGLRHEIKRSMGDTPKGNYRPAQGNALGQGRENMNKP